MQILRARAYGFCFGVRDALAVAMTHPTPTQTTIYGELVHNEQVLDRLSERGYASLPETDRSLPAGVTHVLVTAHGISDQTRSELTGRGLTLIDTTCPLVRRVHAAAQAFARDGRRVVIIGQPGHVEVRGIVEDLESASVWLRPDDVRSTGALRLGVVCQTTTRPDVAAAVRTAIEAAHPGADIAFADTICQPTKDRQAALEELIDAATVVVVVGGTRSNNSRALAERARIAGRRAFLVQTADDLDPAWFDEDDIVGLTAGTSTPDDVIAAVEQRLRTFAPCEELDHVLLPILG